MPTAPNDCSNRVATPSSSSSLSQIPSSAKSMEEVWNDIRLSSLCDYSNLNAFSLTPTTTSTTHPALRSLVLHDFLSGPLIRDSPSRCLTSTLCNLTSIAHDSYFLGSLNHHQPSLLSLTSASESLKQSQDSSFPSSSDALDSSASRTKKRSRSDIYHSSDRHHKRLIKNRESAARSRARKQAYTYELENEVASLREENARLRKQQEEFHLRPLDQHLKKRTLHRTSTAPF